MADTADTAQPNIPLEPEEDEFHDPGYAEDFSVLTQSVRSSVYNYKYENGRRYHAFKEGAYFAPNDEPEQERLNIQARAMLLASGNMLHHSPIEDPTHIIDIGTGTGQWAIEMGDTYPDAEVIGVDLSPIQPNWVPPNVKFEVDDVEDDWTWPPNHFDLIFSKLMISGSIKDKKKYFTQAFRCLKPGGYVEDHEIWSQIRSDHVELTDENSAMTRWANLMAEGIAKMGPDMRPDGNEIVEIMREVGFVDIVYRPFKVPTGTWPKDKVLKDAGAAQLVALLEGIQALSLAIFTRALGWTQEEVEVFLVDCRKDLKQKKKRLYWPGFVIYGRKPKDS